MASATIPTSIRLSASEKRRIAAAARRRGLSPSAYIKRAALESAEAAPDDAKLARLAALVEEIRAAVEDELDYRTAAAAWNRHRRDKTRLLTGDEVRRELGLPD